MTKEEKIEAIKKVLLKYEESISDGFNWYCGKGYDEYDTPERDEQDKKDVDETLNVIAKEILESIKER